MNRLPVIVGLLVGCTTSELGDPNARTKRLSVPTLDPTSDVPAPAPEPEPDPEAEPAEDEGPVDTAVDTGGPCEEQVWYVDVDGDGYGWDDPFTNQMACEAPYRMVGRGDDCDDRSSATHPDRLEVCDGRDNDCNGVVDDDPWIGTIHVYPDVDGDGWGAERGRVERCYPEEGESHRTGDCDDADPSAHPGQDEQLLDDIDNNCDGLTDLLGQVGGRFRYEWGHRTGLGERECVMEWEVSGQADDDCPTCDLSFQLDYTFDSSSSWTVDEWCLSDDIDYQFGLAGSGDRVEVWYGLPYSS